MYGSHFFALVIFALFAAGAWTRVTGVLAAAFVISYANRATGALFGLDQISAFLTLYLAIGNSGGAYSIDSWLGRKTGQGRAVLFRQTFG